MTSKTSHVKQQRWASNTGADDLMASLLEETLSETQAEADLLEKHRLEREAEEVKRAEARELQRQILARELVREEQARLEEAARMRRSILSSRIRETPQEAHVPTAEPVLAAAPSEPTEEPQASNLLEQAHRTMERNRARLEELDALRHEPIELPRTWGKSLVAVAAAALLMLCGGWLLAEHVSAGPIPEDPYAIDTEYPGLTVDARAASAAVENLDLQLVDQVNTEEAKPAKSTRKPTRTPRPKTVHTDSSVYDVENPLTTRGTFKP